MRWVYRFTFVAAMMLGLCTSACDTTENNLRPSAVVEDPSKSVKAEETVAPAQGDNIASIWEHPDRYEGREVVLTGTYLGWRGQVAQPKITRSDWAMQDDTGAIYVVGMPARGLDPLQDVGRPLEVTGVVTLSDESVPYIQAEKVVPLAAE